MNNKQIKLWFKKNIFSFLNLITNCFLRLYCKFKKNYRENGIFFLLWQLKQRLKKLFFLTNSHFFSICNNWSSDSRCMVINKIFHHTDKDMNTKIKNIFCKKLERGIKKTFIQMWKLLWNASKFKEIFVLLWKLHRIVWVKYQNGLSIISIDIGILH